MKTKTYFSLAAALVCAVVVAHPLLDRPTPPKRGDLRSVKALRAKVEAIEREAERLSRETGKHVDEESLGLDYLEALLWRTHQRAYPNDQIDVAAYERARAKRNLNASIQAIPGSARWESIGPRNLDIPYRIYYGVPPLSGRVNALAIHPTQPNTFFLGSAGGGVWKSTNAGSTWVPLTDGWETLQVSCLKIAPSNPDIIYVGTGDFQGYGPYSVGIMKSTDGGATWTNLGRNPLGNFAVSSIAVDPDDPNLIHAATGRGKNYWGRIYRSTDGGQTWASAFAVDAPWSQLTYGAPRNDGTRDLWAVGGGNPGRVYKSTDRGQNWTAVTVTGMAGSMDALDVGTSPADPDTAYLLANNQRRIYKTTNGGTTWSNVTGNFPNGSNNYNWSQSWYDWHLTVTRRNNQDVVYVGLIDVAQSVDAGGTWSSIGGPTYTGVAVTHNDQHSMAIDPANPYRALVGNDGGVFLLTTDAVTGATTLTPLNATLGVTQFYHIDIHPSNAAVVIGGTQDNATPTAQGNLANWDNVGGGDGAGCAINPLNPQIQYASSQYQGLYKTENGWQSSSGFAPNWGSDRLPFIGVMTLDPTNPNLLYVGTNYLWRYDENTNTWTPRLGNTSLASGTIRAIAVAPSRSQRLYFGGSPEIYSSDDSGSTWTRIDSGTPALPNRAVTDIDVHPTTPTDILVTLSGTGSGHLWRLANTDAGTRVWVDVSGSGSTALPDVPANSVVRDPSDPNSTWYVATDIGVYQTTDGGNNWTDITWSKGLPNVEVSSLRISATTGYLTAGTYGRGIWRISVRPVTITGLGLNPTTVVGGANSLGTVTLSQTVTAPTNVSLSTNHAAATVPATVTVPSGQNSATFTVATNSVGTPQSVTVTANLDGDTRTSTLSINPMSLLSVSINPNDLDGGNPAVGTVTLSAPAPSGGSRVTLLSTRPTAVKVPAFVDVPAGQSSATFPVTTTALALTYVSDVRATLGSVTRSARITTRSNPVANLTLSRASVVGGSSIFGTITLSRPAAATGVRIPVLSSVTAAAQVPSTVVVPAGQTSVNFTVRTSRVSRDTVSNISLNWGAAFSRPLTVQAIRPSRVVLSRSGMFGVQRQTATVILTTLAPAGGVPVTLSASAAGAVTFPSTTVTVPAGATSATFLIDSVDVATRFDVQIRATVGTNTASAPLAVFPLEVETVTLTPNSLRGGQTSVVRVALKQAPSKPVTVRLLSSLTTVATVPLTLTIPANSLAATATVRTFPVRVRTSVGIGAQRRVIKGALLAVNP